MNLLTPFLSIFLGLTATAHAEKPAYVCRPKAPVFIAGQVGDSTYCPTLKNPAYAFGKGPRVLVDESHHNWGKISGDALSPVAGRYHALGEVLKADGYQVEVLTTKITTQVLAGYQLFISIAPLPGDYFHLVQGKVRANAAAFTGAEAFLPEEIAALRAWVQQGGNFLLNTEHQPFLASATKLLAAFGQTIELNAFDVMTFSPLNIVAPTHPIFNGRNSTERVLALPVLPGVGGGVHLRDHTDGGVSLTRFGMGAMITETLQANLANFKFLECTPKGSPQCDYWAKLWDDGYRTRLSYGEEPMKALTLGKGRVAIFTEFSSLTSLFDLSGLTAGQPQSALKPYGGLRGKEQSQMIVNTLRWLTRAID